MKGGTVSDDIGFTTRVPGVSGVILMSFDSDKSCQPTSFPEAADVVPDELMLTAESEGLQRMDTTSSEELWTIIFSVIA
uniref:Uncharacterized protein n=1 Tax=Solanum tuberosum TaxID=4113 RepID=M1BX45_SOLTU